MILLAGRSLTAVRKVPAEAMSLTLNERESSATFTPTDMTGITVGSWLQDDTAPGNGIVWVARTIRQTYLTDTPVITLDHAVTTLRDRILFGEITPATITGTASATSCTARQAINYILNQQSDWTLGTFDYDSVSNPYKFDGDTLYDALEKVSDSLDDAWWSYDFSTYPFRINITEKSETVGTVMRAGRNLSAVTQTIDRTGMYTRFYPIGKDDLHITGNYVSKNESTYGVVAKVEVDTSLETEAELYAWANERLNKHAEPKVTVEVEGFELADATGESMDALTLGTKCRIPLQEYDTMITETITVLNYPDKIHQPDVVRITLANTKTDVTRIIADAIKQAGAGGRGGARQEKEDHAWFEDTDEYVAMVAEKTGIDGLGPGETLYSRLQVEAGKITALTEKTGVDSLGQDETIYGLLEVEAGKVAMVVGTSSGQNYIKAAEISTSINNAGQGVALINADHVNISATNTAHLLSGSIKYDADGNLVLKESSGGGIVVERTSGQTTAQFGVFDNGNLTAGVIATKVNGVSSTYIYGSNIVMSSTDNTPVNVEIAGKLEASDITATFIQTKLLDASSITVNGMNVVGDCYVRNGGGNSQNVSAAIWDLDIQDNQDNTYTLRRKRIQDSSWVNVGTFSRATSLSGTWSGGVLTVTATPQGNTFTADLFTQGHWGYAAGESTTTYYGGISAKHNGGSTSYTTGETFTVDASDIYNAGVTAGEGKFSPASPTLQGTQISGTVYHSVDSPNGVVYYTAGTKVKSTTLYADAGSEYLYKASAEATYYTNGTKAKKASGVTLTREYNWGTLYYWDNDRGDFLPLKNAYWYSSQYQLGATATAFEGSNVYVPDSNGSLYICAGSETLQKAINGAWYYKRSSSGTTCYIADNSGTTNLISSTSIRIAAVAAGYYGGSQVTNTYYTKTP